jgi:hypothetical protein
MALPATLAGCAWQRSMRLSLGNSMAGYAKAALLFAFVQVSTQSFAQQANETRIHAVFQGYYERVRPGYQAGITTEDLHLVLSGTNNVREVITSSNALASQSWNVESKLGGSVWSVDGPHRIVGRQRLPQSIRTFTIEVSGTECKASWKQTLLPGFVEYNIYSIVLRQYAYYRQARMVSSTCEISN